MAAHVLKLDRHDENREIAFELKYLASLTTRQRFELMFRKTREMLTLLGKNGHGKTTEIIKRWRENRGKQGQRPVSAESGGYGTGHFGRRAWTAREGA